jgi:AT-binding transcription factor 1
MNLCLVRIQEFCINHIIIYILLARNLEFKIKFKSSLGTTIGACPDHINGRQTGVECNNCDMILNSPRMPGGIAWNAARNSCKTLKCPKCNWHYKYQETLEIHMKEKHPDNDATCIYCITGQQHPRLARGETYTCGYKPYR